MEIKIYDMEAIGGSNLYESVCEIIDQTNGDLEFELRKDDSFRDASIALDPTVLVALISGASASLTALIVGLLRVVENKKPKGMIIVEGSNGRKIEFPLGTSNEQISQLVDQAKNLDIEKILIP